MRRQNAPTFKGDPKTRGDAAPIAAFGSPARAPVTQHGKRTLNSRLTGVRQAGGASREPRGAVRTTNERGQAPEAAGVLGRTTASTDRGSTKELDFRSKRSERSGS